MNEEDEIVVRKFDVRKMPPNLQDKSDEMTQLVAFLFDKTPTKHRTKDLKRIRDRMWALGFSQQGVPTYLQMINTELNDRTSRRYFWANFFVAAAAFVIALCS